MKSHNFISLALCLSAFIFLTYVNERTNWKDNRARDRHTKHNERILLLEKKFAEDSLVIKGGVQGKQFFDIRFITPEAEKLLKKMEKKK